MAERQVNHHKYNFMVAEMYQTNAEAEISSRHIVLIDCHSHI